jgi:hypothetical protein
VGEEAGKSFEWFSDFFKPFESEYVPKVGEIVLIKRSSSFVSFGQIENVNSDTKTVKVIVERYLIDGKNGKEHPTKNISFSSFNNVRFFKPSVTPQEIQERFRDKKEEEEHARKEIYADMHSYEHKGKYKTGLGGGQRRGAKSSKKAPRNPFRTR